MTAGRPAVGIRSLGASLLDDVLAETLDPAYAQAARARAARGEAPPPRWRGQALVALTMAVAGVLVAVTYDQAAAKAQGRQEIREALVNDIQEKSALSDELAAQLEQLRVEVSRTSDDLLAATAVGQRARDALARAEQGTGAVPVTGPGLLVTLANAEAEADDDPVGGGTAATDPRGRVQDGDLQRVVNALWAVGAEAISINGQRLGPTSAIRFAGEAVLVDFRPVTNPYEVAAIGNPDALAAAFLLNPQVQALAEDSLNFGLRFEFAKEEELSLPAAGSPELRSAEPLDTRRVPGADPTPGG